MKSGLIQFLLPLAVRGILAVLPACSADLKHEAAFFGEVYGTGLTVLANLGTAWKKDACANRQRRVPMTMFSFLGGRWLRLVLPILSMLFFLPEGARGALGDTLSVEDAAADAQSGASGNAGADRSKAAAKTGFIMDMAPLLGENGRILSIAPGCRAVTGILDGEPFIWSRDSGMVRLVPPERYYGMGRFLSDDGRNMAGFITISRKKYPLDNSVEWTRPGFLWKRDGGTHGMLEHGIVDVEWYGLSADGRIALGYGKEPIPGAPAADAPWEEQERFANTPEGKAARSQGNLDHRSLWFHMRDRSTFEEIRGFESPQFLPTRALSRDGKKALLRKGSSTFILDLQTGERRELTFGGAVPLSNLPVRENNLVRAGDPKNPLFRWGKSKYMAGVQAQHRLLPDSFLGEEAPDSPMHRDWLVKETFFCVPNFDARFFACYVTLKSRENNSEWIHHARSRFHLEVIVRLDDKGNGIPIDDNHGSGGPWGIDISDDGKTVLYSKSNEVWIWNEDFRLPGRSYPDSVRLVDYLAASGLAVPFERPVTHAVMSPDGRCFYGELSREDGDASFPWEVFLACMDDVPPPDWEREE